MLLEKKTKMLILEQQMKTLTFETDETSIESYFKLSLHMNNKKK